MSTKKRDNVLLIFRVRGCIIYYKRGDKNAMLIEMVEYLNGGGEKMEARELFPGGEDWLYQVVMLKIAINEAKVKHGIKKVAFAKLIWHDKVDANKTLNNCLSIDEKGIPVRKLGLNEALRAARILDRPFWQLCMDTEAEIHRAKKNNSAV